MSTKIKDNLKLIIESPMLMEGSVQESLNEAKQTVKNYYLRGLLSTPGEKNRNGRVYPMYIWEREVEKYQTEIENKTLNTLGEWMHPSYSSINVMESVMRITKMYIEDGKVYCECKILNDNSDATNKLKALIDEGMKIGISTRGLGKVSSTGAVTEYSLVTADLVDIPSNFNSELTGVVEGGKLDGMVLESGIVKDKEYNIDENGCVGETCTLKEKSIKEINEVLDEPLVLLEKFASILESKDATKMCDLTLEQKEAVLKKFLESNKPKEVKELKELKEELSLKEALIGAFKSL